MSGRELSFHERNRRFMASIPTELDPAAKLLLMALFHFAHEDGGGIYAGADTLCELTGLPRRTVFRQLAILAERGYLLADGWKEHGRGCRTRMRRLDLESIARDRRQAPSKPTHSATHGTVASPTRSATHGTPRSATHGTTPSATHGTQTKRDNQEREHGVATAVRFLLAGAHEAAAATATDAQEWLWNGGLTLLVARGVRPNRHAAGGLMKDLLRMASRRNPKLVLASILRVEQTGSTDYQADLMACIRDGSFSIFDLDEPPADSFDGVTLDGAAELVATVDIPANVERAARQEARQESNQVPPVNPKQEAIDLLWKVYPTLDAYTARQEFDFWMDRCTDPLATVIERLIAASQQTPPPALASVFLAGHHPGTGARH